ncbi:hypothetical protein U1Q18_013191 [Sarracenia purpurea var. burkii]
MVIGSVTAIEESSQVQSKTDVKTCLKAKESRPRGPYKTNDVSYTRLSAQKTGNLGGLKSETKLEKQSNSNSNDIIKVAPIEFPLNASRSHSNAENTKLSKEGDEDGLWLAVSQK